MKVIRKSSATRQAFNFACRYAYFCRRQHNDWIGYVLSFFQLNYFYNIWRTERDMNRLNLLKRENYLWLSSLVSTCSKSLPFTVLYTYIVVAEVETGTDVQLRVFQLVLRICVMSRSLLCYFAVAASSFFSGDALFLLPGRALHGV